MAKNLLAIVQTAALELGLQSPASAIGNPDQQTQQMVALANREGSELAQIEGAWTALRGIQNITLVAGQDTYAFPTDFAYYQQDTFWNSTSHMPLTGPMSPADWQYLKSAIAPAGVYIRYRIMNGSIVFDPVPQAAPTGYSIPAGFSLIPYVAGNVISIEYVSSNWCQSAASVPQSQFLADTDTPLLPDDLFVLGLKWRFLAAKGFNYAEEKDAYTVALSRYHPRDKVTESIHMDARRNDLFLNMGILPAGSWPGR